MFNTSSRLGLAILGSLVLNGLLWAALATGASQVPPHQDQTRIEVQRVIIDNKGKTVEKKVEPKAIKERVQKIAKKIEQRRPVKKERVVTPQRKSAPPPPGAHNKVIAAVPKGTVPDPDAHKVLDGGSAPVGKPTTGQNQGNGTVNPPVEPPKIDPPKVDPPKVDPPKVDPPKVDPPKVDPPKVDPPVKPKGPTREAEPSSQVSPEIPERLRSAEFKSFVRVKVEIADDGSFSVVLRTSSGNAEVDRLILDSLKKWRWKPALKDGVPVPSTQLFKFEIEVK